MVIQNHFSKRKINVIYDRKFRPRILAALHDINFAKLEVLLSFVRLAFNVAFFLDRVLIMQSIVC